MLRDKKKRLAQVFAVITAVSLLALIIVRDTGHIHPDIKVKALHMWEKGRAKNCMLLTGRAVTQGVKDGADPKEMRCTDQLSTDPNDMNWDYVRIANVRLDDEGEKAFHNSEKWGVRLVCREVSPSELKCIFDGTP
jgi:hypothetical protein